MAIALLAWMVPLAAPVGGRDENPTSRRQLRPMEPIEVRCIHDLRFGAVVGNRQSGGLIIIDASTGRKSVEGGAVNLGGLYGPAKFEIRGEPNAPFVIRLPKRVPVTGGKLATVGVLTDFTSSPKESGTLGPDGLAVVYVGATLTLAPQQTRGDFAAAIELSVDYPPWLIEEKQREREKENHER